MVSSTPPATQSLDAFLESVINAKYGITLDSEARKIVKEDLSTALDRWIALKTMTELSMKSDTAVNDFRELTLRNAPPAEVQAYLTRQIPDYPGFLTQVLIEFKAVYIGQTQ